MIQYSTMPQSLKMKEQQQECSEIHTVQLFREFTQPCSTSSLASNQKCAQQSPQQITTSAMLIPDRRTNDIDEIGDDWIIGMGYDVTEMEQPSTVYDRKQSPSRDDGEPSLYSFYFENSIHSVSLTDLDNVSDDDFLSITSESDMDLDGEAMDDIWEDGLDNPIRANFHPI